MKLNNRDMTYVVRAAIQAAEEAGQLIKKYTKKKYKILSKTSATSAVSQALTEVDLLSEKAIVKHLKPMCEKYDIGLLTEEQEDDGSRFKKDYFWCVDPLDGTLCFIEGRPGFAVSIALVAKDGTPIVGVVYHPNSETLYHAVKGEGAFKNHDVWELELNDEASAERIQEGGSVMNGIWVIEKAPAYFFKPVKSEDGGGCLWDYAATACIYNELGAWMSTMGGEPVDLNAKKSLHMNKKGIILASDKYTAKKVLNKAAKLKK
jgi:fructose-1,6-bisphosphatase/inositol monophosphatase family enzyme